MQRELGIGIWRTMCSVVFFSSSSSSAPSFSRPLYPYVTSSLFLLFFSSLFISGFFIGCFLRRGEGGSIGRPKLDVTWTARCLVSRSAPVRRVCSADPFNEADRTSSYVLIFLATAPSLTSRCIVHQNQHQHSSFSILNSPIKTKNCQCRPGQKPTWPRMRPPPPRIWTFGEIHRHG